MLRKKEQDANALIYSQREEDIMKEVFTIIVNNQDVLREFEHFVEQDEQDDFCASLINIAIGTGLTFKMIRVFVEDEFRRNVQGGTEGSIMRANTIASKLAKAYLNTIGRPYLQDVLGGIVHKLVISEHKISLEVDPTKCESEEEAQKHLTMLIDKVKLIIDAITAQSNLDKMPPEIRIIAGYFAEFSRTYAPSQLWALVGGFLFLRYFNPALSTPESFGLLPEGKVPASKPRRNLILITKILQNLSNGVEFGRKEQFMMVCNGFIKDNKSRMEKYLENAINFHAKSTHDVPDPTAIHPEDLHYLHRILTQKQDKVLGSFKDRDEAQKLSKLLENLGSYQSKVSFNFLAESVRKAVTALLEQHHEEASFIGWVDKKKRSKVQKRCLIVGHFRIFSVKPSGKLARQAHLLELTEIKSPKPGELFLHFKNFSIVCDSEEVDDIIYCVRRSFAANFSGMPKKLQFKLDVQPESRVIAVDKDDEEPCGGFVGSYRSLCNYYSTIPNFEVCWHFTHLPPRIKAFDVKKFTKTYSETPLANPDLGPLFWSLRFNSYFDSFSIKNLKLDKESFLDLAETMKYNRTINSITLSGVSGTKEGFLSLIDAFAFNKGCVVTSLDLSHNPVEDKAVAALGHFVQMTPHGTVSLNLTDVSVGPKGLTALFNGMKDRVKIKGSSALTFLALSENKLDKVSDLLGITLSVAGGNLKELRLSNTSANIQQILEGLKKGCAKLEVLDLSKNRMKAADCTALVQLLAATSTLGELNLASTKIPTEFLKEILTAVSKDVELKIDLSDNGLGLAGAAIIAQLPFTMTNIHTLNVSDNDFGDEGLATIAQGLCSSETLKSLVLDRNFKERSKHRQSLITNLGKLIMSNNSLESLSIAGGKSYCLKQDIVPFLYCLGQNTSLTSLNIASNQMGNTGAIALSKALRQNNTLVSLEWDENLTGLLGFVNIKNALKSNQTLKNMPLPVYDVGYSLKNEPQSVADVQKTLNKIEKLILNNQLQFVM